MRWGGTILLLVGLAALPHAAAAGDAADPVREALRQRLEGDALDGRVVVRDEPLTTIATLHTLYVERDFRPLWLDAAAWPRRTEALRQGVRAAAAHGLRPRDYHLEALEALPRSVPEDPRAAVGLELLLSDTFLRLASHRLHGKVDPVAIHPEWTAPRRTRDLGALMVMAVDGDQIPQALADLAPKHPDYGLLVRALARMRAQRDAGGFTPVPPGPTLREGDEGPRVEALRRRVREAGEALADDDAEAQRFGPGLTVAMRSVQERLGLDVDGVVGARTLAALNVPAQDRVNALIASMERFRWLPEDLGARHIIVNIAGFWLRMEVDGETVLEMPVVVGRDYRQTPVFSATMTYVVLNPSWEVPPSIANRDKLPEFRRDASAMVAAGFEVLEGWGAGARPIDVASIDWSTIRGGRFPYRLRQKPGPNNALGQVKFMFPNTHAVYLHDSPARELFARSERIFSSGCVRLSDPGALLRAVFAGTSWTPELLDARLAEGTEATLPLPGGSRLAVHLLYWTAWADDEDRIHYRRDVYGRDARLIAALRADGPGLE